MNYRKDYDAYPDNHQDYDDYYDDYFYDEPDSGNSEEADFEDDWDEDFELSPVRNQRHRSSSSKPAGRREEREDNHLYEDEIARMRSRKRQPDSRKRTNGTKRSRAESQPEVYSRKGRSGSNGRMKKRKNTSKIFAGIGVLLVLIIGVLFVQRWWKLRDGFWNIAVFGVDSRSGSLEKGALSDVEIICSINKKTNEIRLVSVYRDTYLQIDEDGQFHKINEAYFLGGHEQAVAALKRNLDLQIDDYATFNWKAVADAINLLGGIDLEITDKEFAYINSFITETVESTGVGSHHLEHAGMNHLDGVQAVAYCRLRLMDTDFNRTERQRKVVMLALEKAKQADMSVLSNIVAGVLPQLSTSIGAEDVMPIAKSITKYEIGQTAGFPFAKTTARIGKKDCVIPMTLESNVAALHQFLYGPDDSYRVSSETKAISKKISEASGVYEEGEIPGFIYNPEKTPSDNQGSGDAQSSQSGNSSKPTAAPAPAPTPTPETVPETEPETTVPESSEEETESETETLESDSETIENNDGAEESSKPSKPDEEQNKPASPIPPNGNTGSQNQPGLNGPSNGPSGTTGESEQGPGAGLPEPDSSSPGIIHSGSESAGTSPANPNAGPGVPEEMPLYAPSYE